MMLAEQYRPRSFAEVVAQDNAIKQIQCVARRSGYCGRPWLFTGATGTGKTTLALIIAHEVADPACVVEVDASEATPAYLRELEDSLIYYGGPTKSGRAVIFNEIHGLRKDSVRQLLVFLERIPSHVCIILTTTADGLEVFEGTDLDARPLLTRCTRIALARQGIAKPAARWLAEIAEREGLSNMNGGTEQAAYKLIQAEKNSIRGALDAIERGALLT